MLHALAELVPVVVGAGAVVVRRTGAVVARWWVARVVAAVVCGRAGGGVVDGGVVDGGEVGAVVGGGVVDEVVAGVVVGSVVAGAALGDVVPTVGVCVGVPGVPDPHPARMTAATPATTVPAIRLCLMQARYSASNAPVLERINLRLPHRAAIDKTSPPSARAPAGFRCLSESARAALRGRHGNPDDRA